MKNIVLIVIILILLGTTVYFVLQYSAEKKALDVAKAGIQTEELNVKILDFTYLFIKDVLKADGEVDFETRLKLENAVRDLNDDEVLAQWQKFTGSQTEDEAQTEVKNLLELLILKIKK